MVSVEDDWFGSFEVVLEGPCEPLVPTLTHSHCVEYGLLLLGVEVPVEVVCRDGVEVKGVELDLVATKSLADSVGGQYRQQSATDQS